jgi:hypothetical protein
MLLSKAVAACYGFGLIVRPFPFGSPHVEHHLDWQRRGGELVRIAEDGADLELKSCSQMLVRSDMGNRLPDRFYLGGSADRGLDPDMGRGDGR